MGFKIIKCIQILIKIINPRKHGDTGFRGLMIAILSLKKPLPLWAYVFVAEEIARGFYSITSKALFFAMPLACGAILVAIFQRLGIAVTFSLLSSILASLIMDGRIEFFIYFFISSVVAAYGVKDYRERGILIKTGLKVGLLNIVLCLSIETFYGSLYSFDALIAIIAGFIEYSQVSLLPESSLLWKWPSDSQRI